MSVGLQRLRDEPDVIRQGAADKGEDPSLVDTALAADADRRRLLGESETLKAERNATSKRIGEAITGGAAPDSAEVAGLKAASTAAGDRIKSLDAELAAIEATLDDLLLRIPNPPDPEDPGRWRGGQRHGPHLGRAAGPRGAARRRGRCRRPGRRGDLDPQAPLGDRGVARHPRQRSRREDRGFRLPGLQGRRFGAPARA